MTAPRPLAAAAYARFLVTAAVVAAVVSAIGYLPARTWGGAGAVTAMLAGSVIAVAASAIGGVPIALAGPEPLARPPAAILAMAVRLMTALLLGLAAAATGRFASRPLALWTAISYAAQLVVDSRYAMQAVTQAPRKSGRRAGEPADAGRVR